MKANLKAETRRNGWVRITDSGPRGTDVRITDSDRRGTDVRTTDSNSF